MSIADPAAFIRANTRLQPVPHAPEISLWLADEVTPIWRLTEEELGEMGLPPPFWAFAWRADRRFRAGCSTILRKSPASACWISRPDRAWSGSRR